MSEHSANPTAHGLGRRASHDIRDEQYLMRRLLPRTPSTRNSRTWSFRGLPLDQGATGTCAGHAGVHALMCAPLSHVRAPVSPFDVYREAVLLDGWADNDVEATKPDDELQDGTDGRAVAKALQNRGRVASYVWGTTVDELVEWVLERGPVMIGTNWYDSMFNVTAEGVIKIAPAATIAGGHETVIRRVDKRRGLALLLNSWGSHFNAAGASLHGFDCDPGEGILDFDTLQRLLREDGDALSFVEQKVAPK